MSKLFKAKRAPFGSAFENIHDVFQLAFVVDAGDEAQREHHVASVDTAAAEESNLG